MDMEIQSLEKQLADFIYDLETEDRLVRVGLKEQSESAAIFKKYQNLFTKEVLDEVKKEIEKTSGNGLKEISERIYFTISSSFIGNKLAAESDKITTYFAKAIVKVNGETLPYYELAGKVSKDPIFEKREKYDAASATITTKVNPKLLKLLNSEIELIKSLGFDGYLPYYSHFKKIDYIKFAKIVSDLKKKTENTWFLQMGTVSQEVLGRPFKGISACHLAYLRSLSMFDNFYPKEKVVPAFKKLAADLGLSGLLAFVQIDDVNRPKKNPRAVCYWPKPPDEIHLVIKPIGGEQDFEAMFHEGGHALHGAAVSAKLPYTFRALSRSHALTETYAFLLEDLVFDPAWLSRNLNVSSYSANKIFEQATFVNLMMLRRYLAKFTYEYGMFRTNRILDGPKLYVDLMKEFTGFIARPEYYLRDMDSGFYSADYLRAWIASAQIKDYLKKKFGTHWFENPKAGKFFSDLWSRGVKDEPEDVVRDLGFKPFDTSTLIEGYKVLR